MIERVESTTVLRRGRCEDVGALAALHVSVWRATYGDYAPKVAYTLLDENARLPYWHDAITSQQNRAGVWVAENEEKILGVTSFGPSSHESFEGRTEIKHLYVAQEAQGKGIGRQLLFAVLDQCRDKKYPPVALAVVKQNHKARFFYRSTGGVEIGSFRDPGPLWRSENIVVAWGTLGYVRGRTLYLPGPFLVC